MLRVKIEHIKVVMVFELNLLFITLLYGVLKSNTIGKKSVNTKASSAPFLCLQKIKEKQEKKKIPEVLRSRQKGWIALSLS